MIARGGALRYCSPVMVSFLRKLAGIFGGSTRDGDHWVEPGNAITRAVEASLAPPPAQRTPMADHPDPAPSAEMPVPHVEMPEPAMTEPATTVTVEDDTESTQAA